MEQKLRFGLVLGLLAVLKRKFGPIMINFFHVSWGEKKKKFILVRNVNVHRPSDMEAFRL